MHIGTFGTFGTHFLKFVNFPHFLIVQDLATANLL